MQRPLEDVKVRQYGLPAIDLAELSKKRHCGAIIEGGATSNRNALGWSWIAALPVV